jgi:hypothetical protein
MINFLFNVMTIFFLRITWGGGDVSFFYTQGKGHRETVQGQKKEVPTAIFKELPYWFTEPEK